MTAVLCSTNLQKQKAAQMMTVMQVVSSDSPVKTVAERNAGDNKVEKSVSSPLHLSSPSLLSEHQRHRPKLPGPLERGVSPIHWSCIASHILYQRESLHDIQRHNCRPNKDRRSENEGNS